MNDNNFCQPRAVCKPNEWSEDDDDTCIKIIFCENEDSSAKQTVNEQFSGQFDDTQPCDDPPYEILCPNQHYVITQRVSCCIVS